MSGGGSSNSRAGRVRAGSDPWAELDAACAYGVDGPEWRSHKQLAEAWNLSLPRATERAIQMAQDGILEVQRVKRGGRALKVYRPVGKSRRSGRRG